MGSATLAPLLLLPIRPADLLKCFPICACIRSVLLSACSSRSSQRRARRLMNAPDGDMAPSPTLPPPRSQTPHRDMFTDYVVIALRPGGRGGGWGGGDGGKDIISLCSFRPVLRQGQGTSICACLFGYSCHVHIMSAFRFSG